MRIDHIMGADLQECTADLPLPDTCPRCHCKIVPVFINAFRTRENSLSATFMCPGCRETFTVSYLLPGKGEIPYGTAVIKETFPQFTAEIKFSEEICSLSPRFSKVYNQAKTAEDYNLDEIAGLGYRKALEILMKDYAIHNHPSEEQEIRKTWLSRCIEQYISNEEIRKLAKASAYIGNDEAHYLKFTDEYGIEELRLFIDTAAIYITAEIQSEKALKHFESLKK